MVTFLINGLFDSIIYYKIHVGRKNQMDTGRSSIYKMSWFIYQLTVAVVVIFSISRPVILFLSLLHHFEHFALKSLMRIEQAGWLLFILVSRGFSSEEKFSSSSWLWLGDL